MPGNPVFDYLDAFHPDPAEVTRLKARYEAGAVGDVEVKRRLAKVLNETLDPLRQRRAELIARPEYLKEVLHNGTERVRPVAQATLAEAYAKMGLRQ